MQCGIQVTLGMSSSPSGCLGVPARMLVSTRDRRIDLDAWDLHYLRHHRLAAIVEKYNACTTYSSAPTLSASGTKRGLCVA